MKVATLRKSAAETPRLFLNDPRTLNRSPPRQHSSLTSSSAVCKGAACSLRLRKRKRLPPQPSLPHVV